MAHTEMNHTNTHKVNHPTRTVQAVTALALSALGTLAVLAWTDLTKAALTFHLLERLLATLAAGAWVIAVIADSASQPAAGHTETLPTPEVAAASRAGHWLVAGWLVAATGHLVTDHLSTAGPGQPIWAGLLDAVTTNRPQQLLGLQLTILAAAVTISTLEKRLRRHGTAQLRAGLMLLALTALLPGAIAGLRNPLSVTGWLLAWHVIAFTCWCGGLAILLTIFARSDPRYLNATVTSYSQMAAVAAVTVAITGGALGITWTGNHPLHDLTTTTWGRLLILKTLTAGALVLGLGYAQRRWSLPQLQDPTNPNPTNLYRLATLELVLMGIATTAGVAL